MARTPDFVHGKPRSKTIVKSRIANSKGTLHLHISGDQSEAKELKAHVEALHGKNTTHKSEPVFNPAISEKQRKMMAIAAHSPEKLNKKNRGVLKMSKEQLNDFSKKRA